VTGDTFFRQKNAVAAIHGELTRLGSNFNLRARPFASSGTKTQNHRMFLLTCKVEIHTAAHTHTKKRHNATLSSKYLALINTARSTQHFYWVRLFLDKWRIPSH
jgi:hypothetical protein